MIDPQADTRAKLLDLIRSVDRQDLPALYRLVLDFVQRKADERRRLDAILDEDND